jgi:hypothetical protein
MVFLEDTKVPPPINKTNTITPTAINAPFIVFLPCPSVVCPSIVFIAYSYTQQNLLLKISTRSTAARAAAEPSAKVAATTTPAAKARVSIAASASAAAQHVPSQEPQPTAATPTTPSKDQQEE